MTNTDDNGILLRKVLNEFNQFNNDKNELIRVQNDLTRNESELFAFQIRYAHRAKENEELLKELESKNKLISQLKAHLDSESERVKTLEFEHNNLKEKHQLCIQCMNKIKTDYTDLLRILTDVKKENEKLMTDKSNLTEIFRDQIEDLDRSLKKLIEEKDENICVIKELRKTCVKHECDLEKTNESYLKCIETNRSLEKEIEELHLKYNRQISETCTKMDTNLTQQTSLEIELLKKNSQLDETNLKLNDLKHNYSTQLKLIDVLKYDLHKKEAELRDLNGSYEKTLTDNQNLIRFTEFEKNKFNEYHVKAEDRLNQLENEREQLYDDLNKKNSLINSLAKKFNMNIKLIKFFLTTNKVQTLLIQASKENIKKFKQKFLRLKKRFRLMRSRSSDRLSTGLVLKSKLNECEAKNKEFIKKMTVLETDLARIRESYEELSNDFLSKNQESLMKSQRIEYFETLISQQNIELNQCRIEIDAQKINIEALEKSLINEKATFDFKFIDLEEALNTKCQQIQDRNNQIKLLNDKIEDLKNFKQNGLDRIQQFEDVIKIQRLDIETKENLIKKFELNVEDSINQINSLKAENEGLIQKINDLKKNDNVRSNEINEITRNFVEAQSIIQQLTQASRQIKSSKTTTTQTDSVKESPATNVKIVELTQLCSELNTNLKIKENSIESTNDMLVLKEAEIARLKTRIGLFERQMNQKATENVS